MRTFTYLSAAALAASRFVGAVDINVDDQSSVKSAASAVAKDLWTWYKGTTDSSQLGLLPKPYYWWEAGAMFGTYISYSFMTGDNTYNEDVAKGIFSQASPTKDFMMLDTRRAELGNDDQAFWGLTAMSAAEHKLTPPSGQPDDIWLTLASGAFNDIVGRWNASTCGGGIKWQFIQENNGFKYKSSIANGATFQLGARLALLTGNQTYADKATMIYDWMHNIGLISPTYQVFDGAGDDPDNCTKIDRHEWSYNSGAMLGGTAALANYTAAKNSPDAKDWADRATGIWQRGSQNFFKNNVLYEQPCEDVGTCNNDQASFKAYFARWSVFAGQVFPSIAGDVQSKMRSSAEAAAKGCSGNGGAVCGTKWYNGNYDGKNGVGQDMSGLEVIAGVLAPNVAFVPGGAASGQGSGSSSSTTSSAAESATPTPTTMVSSTVPASSAPASSPTDDGNNNDDDKSTEPVDTGSGPQPVRINRHGVLYMPVAVKY